jgi:hypothetical protein
MVFLLQPVDFPLTIQANNLTGITGGNVGFTAQILNAAETWAIEKAQSKLRQRFNVDYAFAPLPVWNPANTYRAFSRVYLDAPTYVPATAYVPGNLTLFTGDVYICTEDTTGTFNPAAWTNLGAEFSLFNAPPPFPAFSYESYYAVGDQVFWKGFVYTCLVQTITLGQESLIQFGTYQSVPLGNVAPDDVTVGSTYWGGKTAYSIPPNTSVLNTTYWLPGDTRCNELVVCLVDIMLYRVHARIAPENAPEVREKLFKQAMCWLEDAKEGEITPKNLPILEPVQGLRTRYGGQIKNANQW